MRLLLCFASFALIGCASSPTQFSGTPHFAWPVRGGRISQHFKNSSRKHDGLDISARKNTAIYASAPGKVIYAGNGFSGYGKLIIIEHQGDQWASFYAHLNGFKVREGQWVNQGDLIGLMGRTGRATGVHLHFEIRYNLRPVNPLNFLRTRQIISQK